MIEQQNNLLLISFPSPEAAASFKAPLEALLRLTNLLEPAIFVPLSGQSPQSLPDSPEPYHSRHVLLTDERLEALSRQRESGQTRHQRLLRAQTALRDGALPFSKPGQQAPAPSGQPSPRIKAQAEGGFADGAPEAGRKRKSQLKPVLSPSQPPSRS